MTWLAENFCSFLACSFSLSSFCWERRGCSGKRPGIFMPGAIPKVTHRSFGSSSSPLPFFLSGGGLFAWGMTGMTDLTADHLPLARLWLAMLQCQQIWLSDSCDFCALD